MYSQNHQQRHPYYHLVTQGTQETTQLSSTLTLRHDVLRDRHLGQNRGQAVDLHQQPCRHVPRNVAVERP